MNRLTKWITFRYYQRVVLLKKIKVNVWDYWENCIQYRIDKTKGVRLWHGPSCYFHLEGGKVVLERDKKDGLRKRRLKKIFRREDVSVIKSLFGFEYLESMRIEENEREEILSLCFNHEKTSSERVHETFSSVIGISVPLGIEYCFPK